MFRVLLTALLGLSLIGSAAAAQPPKPKDPQKKEAPKDKDKAPPKEAVKEKAKPAVKEVVGMFKSKDLTKKTLTITVDGKDRIFKITDDTKIRGPRDSERELKDEVLDKGYKITVIPNAKDADVADEVKLPFSNDRVGGDKSKDKPKDKPKEKDAPKPKDKP